MKPKLIIALLLTIYLLSRTDVLKANDLDGNPPPILVISSNDETYKQGEYKVFYGLSIITM